MVRLGLGLLTLSGGALLVHNLLAGRKVPLLEAQLPVEHAAVSVIVPARDEAVRIGRLLDGLAAQTTRCFDTLVLNDRSSDGTAALAAGYTGCIPGLRVVEGVELPLGWAGKCWACWQGARLTTAPWLLFLDADTAPAPGLITTLMQYGMREQLDLLTLLPFLELDTFWERVLMPAFVGLIQAAFPLELVNDPQSPVALANGQCILIRREVYFASGGHQAVRASVLEDTELGMLVKSQGYRLRAVGGPDLMRVRMYTRWSEVSEGLRKNAWAGYAAGGRRAAWGGTQQALLAFLPFNVLLVGLGLRSHGQRRGGEVAAWGLLMWAMTMTYWGYMLRRLHGLNPLWALLYPLGTLSYFALAGWAWLTLRFGRGVTWKGRVYQ
ncbi:MAG: glycosyltransferase [Herpetosiphonaceae bacterium]|nr:glycosyltransferase [Herpetosiphonaceae bacterium]